MEWKVVEVSQTSRTSTVFSIDTFSGVVYSKCHDLVK